MPEMTIGETQRALSDQRDRYFAQSRLTKAGARAELPTEGCCTYTIKLAPVYKRVWWWMRSLF